MSNSLNRQIERKKEVNKKKQMRVPVPQIGGQKQPFDVREAIQKKCAQCECEYFNAVAKLAVVSKMSPSNSTGQDVLIKVEVYLCRSCGLEYGQQVPS